jgi:PAS domain-containing protein
MTLSAIGDAVITTDTENRITFMNAVAESLTGWSHQKAAKQPLVAVLRIVNERTRETVENPAKRALREGAIVGLYEPLLLVARDRSGGRSTTAPRRSVTRGGESLGACSSFATSRKGAARSWRSSAAKRCCARASNGFDSRSKPNE